MHSLISIKFGEWRNNTAWNKYFHGAKSFVNISKRNHIGSFLLTKIVARNSKKILNLSDRKTGEKEKIKLHTTPHILENFVDALKIWSM